MEEHCPEPGLPARGDYVIVAQALSQVSKSSGKPFIACRQGTGEGEENCELVVTLVGSCGSLVTLSPAGNGANPGVVFPLS